MKDELILFETADREIKLAVPVENDTVWLNRHQLAELFGRDVKTIGKHINNALKEELDDSVVANFATTASDGKVYQNVFGGDVYPSLEEKAANLLYFMVKDHPYADGCKRIAASLFLEFLSRNDFLYKNGQKRISDGTLVAITLMIAESNPSEKDIMVNLVMNLLAM